MISYATLAQLQSQSPNPTSGVTADDTRLLQFGMRASGVIDHLKKVTFAPTISTEYVDATSDEVSAFKLILPDPLLSLTSVTLSDSTSIAVGTYVRAEPRSSSPAWWLKIINSAYNFHSVISELDNDIAIAGIWGWHSDYDNAWVLSGDSVQDATGITATATSITVTDADGTSGSGFTPRFSAGNLIRIESEYLFITATNTTTNALTVVRGVRGSTAATHAKSTAIYVYEPDGAITRACMLLTDFNYSRRGKHERVSFDGVQVVAGLEVPQEVSDILANYNRFMMGSA